MTAKSVVYGIANKNAMTEKVTNIGIRLDKTFLRVPRLTEKLHIFIDRIVNTERTIRNTADANTINGASPAEPGAKDLFTDGEERSYICRIRRVT